MRKTGNPHLPPLMKFQDGTEVQTLRDMKKRRSELWKLACDTFIGTQPESTPQLLTAEVTQEKRTEDGSKRQKVQLTFDTPNKISFEVKIWIPKGKGPFPAFMMVSSGGPSKTALARGYVVCMYPGSDGCDSSDCLLKEYPACTWSRLHRRAWIGSRALDYVVTMPEVDGEKVCMSGHSRDGKQSVIAASFDQRIKAVVSSSSGTPANVPYRFASKQTFLEPPDCWPNNWFINSLKSYTGREHELPTDAHVWFGLIAPRPCLMSTAYNDGCESTMGTEQTYLEARKVYQLYGKPEALRIHWRPGAHGVNAETIEAYFDWFDLWFNRGKHTIAEFPETFIHQFDWKKWRSQLSAEETKAPKNSEPAKARIQWALGRKPKSIAWDGKYTFLSDNESGMLKHDRWAVPDTARIPVSFGENVRGNLYYNTQKKDPSPVVIWLHPYCYPCGYNEVYGVKGNTTVYHRLAEAGYAVLAFDQCGFGLRLFEGRDFYKKYPKWSRLGRMVHDVHSAVDFLVDGKGKAKSELPTMRRDQIFVLGYAMGGMVGLYSAALDKRITGVASFAGFTPLRTNTDDKLTGGNRRFWELHALQPHLGLFHKRESQIPYDFDDVLSLIAPRPCLVVAPTRDRFADHKEVVACVTRAEAAWGENRSLALKVPDDISRFQKPQQDLFLEWIKRVNKKT